MSKLFVPEEMIAGGTQIMIGLSAINPNKPTTSDTQVPKINLDPKNQLIDKVKKFSCKKCRASFLQLETFKRHINFYCNTKTDEPNQVESGIRITQNSTMTPTPQNADSASVANLAELLAVFQQREQLRQNALLRQNATRVQSLLDPNGLGASTNTIILPVAYHQAADPTLIQIIGPPQTIIPVAIGRQMPATSRPLLLDGSLLPSLQLASNGRTNSIPLGSSNDFHLPLACIQQWPALPTMLTNCLQPTNDQATSGATATATVTSMNALSPSLLINASKENGKVAKRTRSAISTPPVVSNKRRCSSADKPLDLTTNGARSTDESAGSSSETMDNEAEKPSNKRFACECGVSFLSNSTLESHKKYYCSQRVVDESEERESIRKVPSRCSQCDYSPATHAQLAQHIRHKHCAIQAYVCLLCGYKGYSARGIKNHLRNSHPDEMTKRKASIGDENVEGEQTAHVLSDKSLLQDYVFCVTDATKQMPCNACRSTFPTQDLLQRHNCPAKKSDKDVEDRIIVERKERVKEEAN